MSFVQALDFERAKRGGKLAVAPDFREVFAGFAGFDAERRLEELFGCSWMTREARVLWLEVLVEFAEASRRTA